MSSDTAALGPPAEQQRSAVWRHPRRAEIHALYPRRSSDWISIWLEQEYPLESEDGEPLPKAARNRALRIGARTLERYRRRWLPELTPGVDVLPPDLEDLLGRVAPAPPRRELELLDSMQDVALHNLTQAMLQDADLEMVQPLTLTAQEQALSTVMKSIDAKGRLGVEGYEPTPVTQNLNVQATSRNVNVALHGRIDPSTGEMIPGQPEKLDALRDLLAQGPEAAREVLAAARVQADVDAEAVEVDE